MTSLTRVHRIGVSCIRHKYIITSHISTSIRRTRLRTSNPSADPPSSLSQDEVEALKTKLKYFTMAEEGNILDGYFYFKDFKNAFKFMKSSCHEMNEVRGDTIE